MSDCFNAITSLLLFIKKGIITGSLNKASYASVKPWNYNTNSNNM